MSAECRKKRGRLEKERCSRELRVDRVESRDEGGTVKRGPS